MSLLLENGTGISGAVTYITLAEARAYAAARGLTLPASDPALEQLLVRATDYLESLRAKYQGASVHGLGYLQWPRSEVFFGETELGQAVIPAELKAAQCQLAVDLQKFDPMATASGPAIKQKTVGPLTTIYAVSDDSGTPRPIMPLVAALLAPLMRSGWGQMRTTRI